jgi:hypothetical protein
MKKERRQEGEKEPAPPLLKTLEEKVNESVSENKPLECIGYFLPAIEFAKFLPTNSITK